MLKAFLAYWVLASILTALVTTDYTKDFWSGPIYDKLSIILAILLIPIILILAVVGGVLVMLAAFLLRGVDGVSDAWNKISELFHID